VSILEAEAVSFLEAQVPDSLGLKSLLRFPMKHPLRFLLYLEWILLSIVFLVELPRASLLDLPRMPGLNLLCILLFAGMGLRLPLGQSRLNRWIYSAISFSLILLAASIGGLRLFSLLYIVLVIRTSLLLDGQSRSLMTAVAFFSALIVQSYRIQTFNLSRNTIFSDRIGLLLLSIAILLGLVFLFLQLLVSAVLAERKSQEQLRAYALRIEDIATLQERNRIAREIHDSLGHSLTAVNLHLKAGLLQLNADPTEAKDLLQEAKRLNEIALQEVRQSVAALRSDPLTDKTLKIAIQELIEELQRTTKIQAKVNIEHGTLSNDVKIAAYRIVQEALTNICKYAQATEVILDVTKQRNQLIVNIQDNGQGFVRSQITTGFGLQGMQERTLALGGHFELITAPNQGCTIQAIFPLVTL
jgi:signal transduction histidine kinase